MPENTRDVLVVDDDWMSRELLETYLKSAGYRVAQANSGETALEMVFDDPPRLILLDVNMPGMSGFETCERLRQNPVTQMLPVLLITAFQSEEDAQRAEEVGADGFVTKPYDVPGLLKQVAAFLQAG